jgi:quercetin dioxygenase-like cupin family protein
MDIVFNEKDIEKRVFDDRWVRFAFGPQGKVETENLNLGVTRFREGKTSLTHKHQVDEALYILSGKGTVKVGEESRKVAAGDFVYVPRDTGHTMITDCKSDLKIFFVFSGKIVIDH